MEENASKLHFECSDFNSFMRVTVYAKCIYVLTEYLEYLSCRKFEFLISQGSVAACIMVRWVVSWVLQQISYAF